MKLTLDSLNKEIEYADKGADVTPFDSDAVVVAGYNHSGDYETDVAAIVRLGNGKYVGVEVSGCSCGSTATVCEERDTPEAALQDITSYYRDDVWATKEKYA